LTGHRLSFAGCCAGGIAGGPVTKGGQPSTARRQSDETIYVCRKRGADCPQ
jgi:hypothetical protein